VVEVLWVGVVAGLVECLWCFFTLVVPLEPVLVLPLLGVLEAAGACAAIAAPTARERPIKAEVMVFMVSISLLEAVVYASIM
jgi:hypothetical protein